MAALYGDKYFWNITFKDDIDALSNASKEYFTDLTLVIGIALIVLGPVIMTSNGIVIAAIWKDPYKQLRSSPSNIIIASMAFCDFLVGLVSVPVQGLWFISMSKDLSIASLAYAIAFALGVFLIGLSILHILLLTIDRVLAVSNPLLYKSRVTRRRVHLSLALVWLIVVLLTIATIPVYNRYYILSTISIAFFTFISLPAYIFSIIIIYYIHKHTRELKKDKQFNSMRSIIERDRKTAKSILIILGFFSLCFTPFLITWFILYTCSKCQPNFSALLTCFYFAYVITHVNSAVNPFLYAFRLPKFRKPVAWITKSILTCDFSLVVDGSHSQNSSSCPNEMNDGHNKVRPVQDVGDTRLNTQL